MSTTPTTTDPAILVARNVTPDEHTVELSLCPGDRATAVAGWLLATIRADRVLSTKVILALAEADYRSHDVARLRASQHLGAVLAQAVYSLTPGDAEALAHDLEQAAWPAPECAIRGCDGYGAPDVCAAHADTPMGA